MGHSRIGLVPINSYVNETEHVAHEDWTERQQHAEVCAVRHFEFQHHDRDDDGDNAVASSRVFPIAAPLDDPSIFVDQPSSVTHLLTEAPTVTTAAAGLGKDRPTIAELAQSIRRRFSDPYFTFKIEDARSLKLDTIFQHMTNKFATALGSLESKKRLFIQAGGPVRRQCTMCAACDRIFRNSLGPGKVAADEIVG